MAQHGPLHHRLRSYMRVVTLSIFLLTVALALTKAYSNRSSAAGLTTGRSHSQLTSADRAVIQRTSEELLSLHSAQNETINICEIPTTLPRNLPLTSYSPVLCFDYSGLRQEVYSLR